MKEYTFMFMNVHKKHTIYGKMDEDQRGDKKYTSYNGKNYEHGRNVLNKCLFKTFCQELHYVNSGQRANSFL